MSTTASISLTGVCKTYRRQRATDHAALTDVNLSIGGGEIVGLIGNNGAGKSTLMRLIARISAPTQGTLEINGTCAALLDVGATFHAELTGRENIKFGGMILGLSQRDIKRLTPSVTKFAAIGDYIDQPLRMYSSGMRTRLGFAIATAISTDILLLDEAIEVGDSSFRNAAAERTRLLAEDGHIVLVCSHSMVSILDVCARCIWLDNGHIRMDGTSDRVVDAYLEYQYGLVDGVENYRSSQRVTA